ncbi:hypothetical protein [Chitinimonas sp.]|uniref:hypothetical protein n=1 Tax=Chitinimonas sp. TaxID=1934313 RepID=UPI002F94E2C7
MAASYFKTDKGRAEIDARQAGLSAKARRLLILVDGRKAAAELLQLSGAGEEFDALLQQLQTLELIGLEASAKVEAGGTVPAAPLAAPAVRPPEPVVPIAAPEVSLARVVPAAELTAVRDLMLSSAREYLGLMGAELIRSLETAEDERSVRACASRWHLAMRESRRGKDAAGSLFAVVRQVLHAESA